MSSALVMTTAAFQTCGAAVYFLRIVIKVLKLRIDFNQTMTQGACGGNLQYFITKVVLDVGKSRRCLTLPLDPSFAVQYVRRNGC